MAIANINIDEFHGFSKRLAILSREHNWGNPEDLANALYDNKECRRIIKPRERKNKDGIIQKSSLSEKNAIKRAIQYHYNETDAYKIQSSYMYAYSIIFNCSLDYLYGKTAIKSTNLEVCNICTKTGLSENAVETLIKSQKQNEYLDDNLTYSMWWSLLLQEESFQKLPQAWHSYANLVLEIMVLKDPPKPSRPVKEIINEALEMYPGLGKFLSPDLDVANTETEESHFRELKQIQEKEDSKLGAFYKMLIYIEALMNKHAEDWANIMYPGYTDRQNKQILDFLRRIKERSH